jgi:hypothetical protein
MRALSVVLCALLLTACGGGDSSNDMPDTTTGATAISSDSGRVTLGVNSYLWHATLDTLAFMPLASADPFGGVIITDWYSAPEDPSERMKVTIYILDRRLRADGLKIAVQMLCAGDVPLSVGAHPYGPCAQLHHGRCHRPLPPRPGL